MAKSLKSKVEIHTVQIFNVTEVIHHYTEKEKLYLYNISPIAGVVPYHVCHRLDAPEYIPFCALDADLPTYYKSDGCQVGYHPSSSVGSTLMYYTNDSGVRIPSWSLFLSFGYTLS